MPRPGLNRSNIFCVLMIYCVISIIGTTSVDCSTFDRNSFDLCQLWIVSDFRLIRLHLLVSTFALSSCQPPPPTVVRKSRDCAYVCNDNIFCSFLETYHCNFCKNISQICGSLLCRLVYIFPDVIKMDKNKLFSLKKVNFLLMKKT